MGQFWFILGRTVSHFGPRDGRFSPILAIFGAPRRPFSVELGTLTRPILVDKGAQKLSILVKLKAVGGRILVHFGPPSQPLWAPGRPIFAKSGHFWGAKTPDVSQTWNPNSAHFGCHRSTKTVKFGQIGGGRWANFDLFLAAESATLGPGTADFRQFWPSLGRQGARFRSNLER